MLFWLEQDKNKHASWMRTLQYTGAGFLRSGMESVVVCCWHEVRPGWQKAREQNEGTQMVKVWDASWKATCRLL